MRQFILSAIIAFASPAAYAQPARDSEFSDFEAQCRTNVGIRTECESSILDVAHAAFGPSPVTCIYQAIWPVAEQIVDPPAARRPWKDVVKVLVEEKGICVPDTSAEKRQ